jgi:hypothetical protein
MHSGKRRWIAALVFCVSCQSASFPVREIQFFQAPPAVQAAFLAYYPGAFIQKISRETRQNQDYYSFTFIDNEKFKHTVVLNEGGDQIDCH